MKLLAPVAPVLICAFTLAIGGCSIVDRPPAATPAPEAPATTAASATPKKVLTLKEHAVRAQPAIMRITTSTCEGGGTGSGFLIDSTHVVTVAHVVDDAQTVTVRRPDGKVSRGSVVGADINREVALIELQTPLKTTRTLKFADGDHSAEVLDSVVALGYPRGLPLSLTSGEVNGLDRQIDLSHGPTIGGLIQFNADISGGNSGGPLLNDRGEVVGLVEAEHQGANGVYYAVPAATATGLVDSWRSSPNSPIVEDCPESYSSVEVTSVHPDASSVSLALQRFIAGINSGSGELTFADGTVIEGFELAFDQITGDLRKKMPDAASLSEEFMGVHIEDAELEKVNNPGPLTDTADVNWTWWREPTEDSESMCEVNRTRITLRLDSGSWKLSKLAALSDSAPC